MAGHQPTSSRPGREPDPRFTFANERTFLAWNRTALALIAGGLVAHQVIDFDSSAARLVVAVAPLLLAGALPVAALRRWRANQDALRLGEPLPDSSLPMLLTAGAVALALLVGSVLVLETAAS